MKWVSLVHHVIAYSSLRAFVDRHWLASCPCLLPVKAWKYWAIWEVGREVVLCQLQWVAHSWELLAPACVISTSLAGFSWNSFFYVQSGQRRAALECSFDWVLSGMPRSYFPWVSIRRREIKMLPALVPSPWLEKRPARTFLWVMHFRDLRAVFSSKSLLTVPCCKWGLLAALDVDGAELLHTPEASGWHTGVGKVSGLLVAARTAGGGQSMVTRQGGAPRRRIVLHWALHAVLLKQLLIYELVVLAGKRIALLPSGDTTSFGPTAVCFQGHLWLGWWDVSAPSLCKTLSASVSENTCTRHIFKRNDSALPLTATKRRFCSAASGGE